MITIYILQLIENKFYVGSVKNVSKSNEINMENIQKNILLEVNGYGSEWTRKYKPIRLVDVCYTCKEGDEDKYTKIMMSKYGIKNVRGGTYNEIILSDIKQIILETEIIEKPNRQARVEITTDDTWICNICDREFEEESEYREHQYKCKKNINTCYKCNKKGHYVTECPK